MGGGAISVVENDYDIWENLISANGKGGIFPLWLHMIVQGHFHSDGAAFLEFEPACACLSSDRRRCGMYVDL
jgi:hypothetical protein